MMIQFEHDYRNKVMVMGFQEPVTISRKADVLHWRSQWTQALKSWHSPYKALIDCTNLTIEDQDGQIKEALDLMVRFLSGFFLKKAIGFGYNQGAGHDHLPFEVCKDEEEASSKVGIRVGQKSVPGDFRSSIQIENHFRQHTVELSFLAPVVVDTDEKMSVLRSKLTNNLMQWHSSWNLLVDCSQFTISPEQSGSWDKMVGFFRQFFLKDLVGYAPSADTYPFPVYRVRHKAAAILQGEGLFSGEDANCQSRRQTT